MKKIIRSTNDLLLAVLMSGLSIFLLLSKKIITGVENGLGGMWAQASTYIHLLAGALTGCGSTGSSSAQEVIDYVNANPGKVTVGSTGSNNVNYGTTMELLKDMGIYDKVTIVPYDGGAASETALQGGIMVAYFMANVVMYVMELGLMKAFVRMVNVKLSFLFPAIVACCVLGVYTLNNRMFDVWVMIIFGVVGYLLICLGIDMAPVILGFILGPLIEKYMRMALISANGNWADMFNRPVSVFFVVIAILFVVVPVIKKAVSQGKKKA